MRFNFLPLTIFTLLLASACVPVPAAERDRKETASEQEEEEVVQAPKSLWEDQTTIDGFLAAGQKDSGRLLADRTLSPAKDAEDSPQTMLRVYVFPSHLIESEYLKVHIVNKHSGESSQLERSTLSSTSSEDGFFGAQEVSPGGQYEILATHSMHNFSSLLVTAPEEGGLVDAKVEMELARNVRGRVEDLRFGSEYAWLFQGGLFLVELFTLEGAKLGERAAKWTLISSIEGVSSYEFEIQHVPAGDYIGVVTVPHNRLFPTPTKFKHTSDEDSEIGLRLDLPLLLNPQLPEGIKASAKADDSVDIEVKVTARGKESIALQLTYYAGKPIVAVIKSRTLVLPGEKIGLSARAFSTKIPEVSAKGRVSRPGLVSLPLKVPEKSE